ncbi:MAG: 30S ribosomal protein S4 [Parcubacteria group bacterium]|nr:30S ribosomal protein S4 [Parcubacteria group bacterium]
MLIKAKEKKERSLGTKLFLKAERCNSPKCAMVRKPYRPGAHGKSRRRAPSELGRQWNENQKMKLTYGVDDSQMQRIVNTASRNPEATGEKIIELLERRLDNALYRLGLAASRFVARQLVRHGHIFINNRRVNIPSYQVNVGDVVSIRPQSRDIARFKDLAMTVKQYEPPLWLSLDKEKMEGKVVSLPKEVEMPFDLNLVVDYYSK